jgi:hypothetical protein
MNILLLFTALTFINVVLQTVKSLCTIRCTTFISASVNALAYGLYTFVIFYTTADGLGLWTKAAITAVANFFGIYIANFIFKKVFSQTTRWKVEVSIPVISVSQFERDMYKHKIEYYCCGYYAGWKSYALFSEDKRQSKIIKNILPEGTKYNIVECVKRL